MPKLEGLTTRKGESTTLQAGDELYFMEMHSIVIFRNGERLLWSGDDTKETRCVRTLTDLVDMALLLGLVSGFTIVRAQRDNLNGCRFVKE